MRQGKNKINKTGKAPKKPLSTEELSLKELPISSIIFSGKVKFDKLARITLIFNAAPAIIIFIFFINGYVSYFQGCLLFSSIFVVSLIFYYPYIADLQEVTNYVDNLAKNLNPPQPKLSFINDVDQLSDAVKTLNESWLARNDVLKQLLLEDEILINSLPNPIVMLDQDLKLLKTNQAAAKILGRNYINALNEMIADSRIQNICNEILVSGEGKNISYEIYVPQYHFFNIRFEKFPMNSPNNISLIFVLQDLTQEKATENMLTDFVANASHEMKTPLASIKGFIETLTEHETDPDARFEFLKIMKDQANRMGRLIDDLLNLSLIESSAGKDVFAPVDMMAVIDEMMLAIKPLRDNRNIKIKLDIENDPPKILGKFEDIIRLCDNLVSNAIKYSYENSSVTIKLASTSNKKHDFPEFHDDEKLLCLSVIDNGIGIETGDIVRLTERFFRVDKSRSSNLGGTGLGLSIVKHIVSNHHGHLEIQSEPGKGSTFSVYFPVA